MVQLQDVFYRQHPTGSERKRNLQFERGEGRKYIDLLFKVEAEIQDLPYEEKKQKRQDASWPILDAF